MSHWYFDHNATGPVAPQVLKELTCAMAGVYGNASSIHHFGQGAKQHLEGARRLIADRIGCTAHEIVFTSGGTESDNLAIFGIARSRPRSHIITSPIEHPAVLNACGQLAREGFEVSYLKTGKNGTVNPAELQAALRPDTALVSVMHANNETGVVQPVEEIAELARKASVLFHCDAVQTVGRSPVTVRDIGADLISISGHKFGAPKGIGALFVRKGVALAPILYGGHHERDRRAGTENVPGAVALAAAASLSFEWSCLAPLRDRLESEILRRIPQAFVNGAGCERLPNTTNIRFDGIEGEALVIALDLRGFAVSSGSACSSGAVEPSHVLLAMGLRPDEARSSVRISLGPGNTAEQVDSLIEAVVESVAHLRRISAAFSSERSTVVTHA